MILSWGYHHRQLSKIVQGIKFNLSRSEFDLSTRYNVLEKLLYYNPDIITKEILYGFYFPFEELVKSIESTLREIIALQLEHLVNKTGKPVINSDGYLYHRARKLILKKLDFLPPPFYRRIKRRIHYLQIDKHTLQDDYLRLEQIISALSDKGYVISQNPKPFYHHIDFQEVLSRYCDRRYTDNFVQSILRDMNVLKMTFQAGSSTESIRPISQEKRIAQLRKMLFIYIHKHAERLALEKKHEFIGELLRRDVDEHMGKHAIDELAELLNTIPFHEAKERVLAQEYLKILPDKLLSNRYEIGPEGLKLKS